MSAFAKGYEAAKRFSEGRTTVLPKNPKGIDSLDGMEWQRGHTAYLYSKQK